MKRNNDHITMLSNGKPLEPKYLKSYYDMSDAGTHYDFRDYRDVPGWVNDAEYVYEKAVSQAEDGAHFVEIGVLYGQSATRMADLIKKSEKDIKFDAIDIFWGIEHGTKNYLTQNQPYQFLQYLEQPRFENWTIMQIVQFPVKHFGLSDYVNFITCDERYAHRLYDDDSLDFVWIDGDHNEGVVYNDLVNFWPKLKSGAMIAGDDMKSSGVYRDVQTFIDDYDLRDYYNSTPLNIGKDGINQSNGFRIIKK